MTGRRLVAAWAVLFVVAALDLVAQKLGWVPMHPELFAALAGVVIAVLLADTVQRGRRVAAGELARARGLAGLAWRAGILLSLGAGTVGWLVSLQGFLVLTESDTVPVGAAAHLQGFEAGPLARPSELGHFLRLDRVELQPRGPGSYAPVSHLRFEALGQPEWRESVEVGRPAFMGALRFQQGAFGFSPRIVVLQGTRQVFDQSVPFTSSLAGGGEVAFEGSFSIERERLHLDGTVSLEGLDERMKGHPRLALRVTHDGAAIGQGTLTPGQFADLEHGYRVGFVGLRRWSEINISRNTGPAPMFVGAGLTLLGALAHAVVLLTARWRG